MHAAGEMLFGFIEENANRADTAGGRSINATVATGQSFFIPQGKFSGLVLLHTWPHLQQASAKLLSGMLPKSQWHVWWLSKPK